MENKRCYSNIGRIGLLIVIFSCNFNSMEKSKDIQIQQSSSVEFLLQKTLYYPDGESSVQRVLADRSLMYKIEPTEKFPSGWVRVTYLKQSGMDKINSLMNQCHSLEELEPRSADMAGSIEWIFNTQKGKKNITTPFMHTGDYRILDEITHIINTEVEIINEEK